MFIFDMIEFEEIEDPSAEWEDYKPYDPNDPNRDRLVMASRAFRSDEYYYKHGPFPIVQDHMWGFNYNQYLEVFVNFNLGFMAHTLTINATSSSNCTNHASMVIFNY